jgi:glutamate--cysteine ligase
VTYSGERPIQALMARGVQYVEVRCLDINPFLPLGIDLTESRFLDAFLLFCALADSPLLESGECHACTDNFLAVVKEGRRPGLQLQRNGQPVVLQAWASELLEQILPLAELLDQSQGGEAHRQALQAQQAKVADPSLTPSAQVLAQLQQGLSFTEFALRQSKQHAEYFRSQPLSAEQQAAFEASAAQSLQEQAELEAHEEGDFDSFAAAYQASILALAV